MEEWGENKMNSFKSHLKLEKHPGCFLGFIVLSFWVFFPSWEIFLKSKWGMLVSLILFFFSSFLFPCSAFLITVLLENIHEFGKDFLRSVTLEAVSGSLISVLHFEVLYVNWFGNLLCDFFINKTPWVLVLFLATYMVISPKDEYNRKITW